MDQVERNICLTVAYDGSTYHGFQRQANTAVTIQQVLEERLAPLFGHKLKIAGAARTDTGVHAYGQVVTFNTTGCIPVSRIPFAARGVLPQDIVIRDARVMPLHFHARLSAKSKLYYYHIHNQVVADPFLRHYAWQIKQKLRLDQMQQAIRHVIGKHDFSAFRGAGGPPRNPVREIFAASCIQKDDLVECSFHGTGFLYHMVRNLVGTLVNVGLGKYEAAQIRDILESKDRQKAGATAPAQGLYLKEVYYD